jgi:phosphatidate cytidylyltransferase
MAQTATASMLSTRILTALVLIPLVLAALFLLPPLAWGLVLLGVTLVAAAEWTRLTGISVTGAIAFGAGILAIGLVLLFLPAWAFDRGWPALVVVVVCTPAALFWAVAAPMWLRTRAAPESPLWMLPVGWLILTAAWVALVQLQSVSPATALAAMAAVWIADTAAYFAGRAFGRRKLAPAISPGKTWEGVYGALAAVVLYALALWPTLQRTSERPDASAGAFTGWIVGAVALVALSVIGDLFESLLKRQAGVKDSGSILPGHGGILDRIDALLAAMPAAALLSLAYQR